MKKYLFFLVIAILIFPSYVHADGPYLNIPPTDAFDKVSTSNDTIHAKNFIAQLNLVGKNGVTVTGSNSSKTVYISGSGSGNGTGGNFTCNDINNCVNLNDTQTVSGFKNFTSGIGIMPFVIDYDNVFHELRVQATNGFATSWATYPKNGTIGQGSYNDILGDTEQNNLMQIHENYLGGFFDSSIRVFRNDTTDFNIENHNSRGMITLSGTDNSISLLSSAGGPGNALLHNVTNPVDPQDAMTKNYFENNVGALGSLTLGPCVSGNILQVNYSLTPNWNCINQTSGATGPTGATGANGSPGSNGATGPTGPTANIDSQDCSSYTSIFSVEWVLDTFNNSTHQFTCTTALKSINTDPSKAQTITGTSGNITMTDNFAGGHQINTADKVVVTNLAPQTFSKNLDLGGNTDNKDTFDDNGIQIRNPSHTFATTLTNPAITGNRTLNLPLTTGTDTLATTGLIQIWTAKQDLGGATDNQDIFDDVGIIIRNPAHTFATTVTSPAITANRTLTLPLLSGTLLNSIPPVKTGGTNWYNGANNEGTKTAVQPVANQTTVYPFVTYKGFDIDKIGFEVNVLLAGNLCMVGIYDDNGTAYPKSLIATGTDQSTSTTGVKSDSVTATLNPNSLYWMAVNCKAAGVTRLVGLTPGDISSVLGETATTTFTQQEGWSLTQNHGSSGFAFSSTFPSTGSKIGAINVLAAWVRAK